MRGIRRTMGLSRAAEYAELSLDGRAALVTGGGRGIGRAVVETLAQAGAAVMVAARTREEIEDVAADIREQGGRAAAFAADVLQPGAVADLVERTVEEFGRLDVLVNNVGGTLVKPTVDLTPSEWDEVVALNLKSVYLCVREALPALKTGGGGSIVSIASIAGLRGSPGVGAYGAAKAGVINLTQTLALELAPDGVRVNCVAPGTVRTEAARLAFFPTPQAAAEAAQAIPLGRLGTPEDVAQAVLFLASPASGWITGQTLVVSGGQELLGLK